MEDKPGAGGASIFSPSHSLLPQPPHVSERRRKRGKKRRGGRNRSKSEQTLFRINPSLVRKEKEGKGEKQEKGKKEKRERQRIIRTRILINAGQANRKKRRKKKKEERGKAPST